MDTDHDTFPRDFSTELQVLLNRFSKENESNTPDFILAKYLEGCLLQWNTAVQERERWYGREPKTVLIPPSGPGS